MATHTFTRVEDEGDFHFEVDFKITSYGSPAHMGSPSYGGDPGDPPEIEINSISAHREAAPDSVTVWEAPNIPQDILDLCEAKILENYDFTSDAYENYDFTSDDYEDY